MIVFLTSSKRSSLPLNVTLFRFSMSTEYSRFKNPILIFCTLFDKFESINFNLGYSFIVILLGSVDMSYVEVKILREKLVRPTKATSVIFEFGTKIKTLFRVGGIVCMSFSSQGNSSK